MKRREERIKDALDKVGVSSWEEGKLRSLLECRIKEKKLEAASSCPKRLLERRSDPLGGGICEVCEAAFPSIKRGDASGSHLCPCRKLNVTYATRVVRELIRE